MEAITKEQAIFLWLKFIDSNRVKKHQMGYGPCGPYAQFILSYEWYRKEISMTLITDNDRPISEKSIKSLSTPFGLFALTCEEANKCRDAWVERNEQKGNINLNEFDELIKALKN